MGGRFRFMKNRSGHGIQQIALQEIVITDTPEELETYRAEAEALARRIQQQGMTQPLTVQKQITGDGYTVVIGERWYYAAQLAGLETVPCVVLEAGAKDAAILHLVKKIQQQKMTFFEEAAAIERLISHYGMTQEDAAICLGKAQSTIANKLRLLRLTEAERTFILENNLTERHARALLRLRAPEERLVILKAIVAEQMNVERTEGAVEHVIGNRRNRVGNRRRNRSVQGIHSFLGMVEKGMRTMESLGIAAELEEKQEAETLVLQIRIPWKQAQQEYAP